VLAAQADDYRYIPLLWASVIALLLPGALLFFGGWLSAWQQLLAQWATFLVLAVAFRAPALTSRLIPRAVRNWRACNLARRQFIELNLHHTEADTGVLIFVSEAERYVEILVDRGIASRIDNAAWETIVAAFTERVKQGRVRRGFPRLHRVGWRAAGTACAGHPCAQRAAQSAGGAGLAAFEGGHRSLCRDGQGCAVAHPTSRHRLRRVENARSAFPPNPNPFPRRASRRPQTIPGPSSHGLSCGAGDSSKCSACSSVLAATRSRLPIWAPMLLTLASR